MKIDVGYPPAEGELRMLGLARRGLKPVSLEDVAVVAQAADVRAARATVDAVTVADDVAAYIVEVVRRTRDLPSVTLGASPRAAVHLLVAAKAAAALGGRTFVTPDDVAGLAGPVLRHRLVLRPEAELERYDAADAVRTALESVRVPR
jgi:MoxR-like ATPase